jgi:hypothetical protein
MPLLRFLQVWATNKKLQLILNAECETEVLFLERRKEDPLDHLYFTNANMKWTSWSAMLMIEYCYDMCECQGFTKCLESLLVSHLDSYISKKRGKVDGEKFLTTALGHINKIQNALYPSPGNKTFPSAQSTILRPTSANNFKVNLTDAISESKWWKFAYPTKKQSASAIEKILVQGNLQKPEISVQLAKSEGQKNLFDRLVHPDTIQEIDFLKGVKSLLRIVYGESMDVLKKVKIIDTQQCAAGLCLIQLLCGSRSRGVIAVNWFDKVSETSEAFIKASVNKEFDDRTRLDIIRRRFGGLDHCIQVHRITKERDQEVVAYQDLAKDALKEGKDTDTIKTLPNTISKKRVIVKPVLFMYLNPAFLDTMFKDTPLLTPEQGVQVFLDLVTEVRKWVFDKVSGIKPIKSPLEHKMIGLSDTDAADAKSKHVIHLTRVWNTNMNTLLKVGTGTPALPKPIFPPSFLPPGRGTHMLRRLYVNRGYYHFASSTLKETAFTRLTLGHKSFAVSLYYTSLIVEQSVPTDVKSDTVINSFETKLASLEERIMALEQKESNITLDTTTEAFQTGDKVVYVKKLPRAVRNTSKEEHLRRAKRKFEELKHSGIQVTGKKLFKLGVSRIAKDWIQEQLETKDEKKDM